MRCTCRTRAPGPLLADLIGGQIQYSFDTMTAATPHVKSGKVDRRRADAAASAPRAIPHSDHGRSQGFQGFEATTWYGLAGPGKLPAAIAKQHQRDVNKVLAMPDVQEKLDTYGAEDGGGSRDKFAQVHLERDRQVGAGRARRQGQGRCMNLTPSLAHFVWLGHPLSGGNPSGPAKPVPRVPRVWLRRFHASRVARSRGYEGRPPTHRRAAGPQQRRRRPTNGLTVLLSSLFPT